MHIHKGEKSLLKRLFRSKLSQDLDQVPELFHTIQVVSKDFVKETESESHSADQQSRMVGTDQSKARYEVMYVGRAKLTSKKVPTGYIDELVDKLHAKDEERRLKKLEESARRQRNLSGNSVRSLPATLEETVAVTENELKGQKARLHNSETQFSPAEMLSDVQSDSCESSVDDLSSCADRMMNSTENVSDIVTERQSTSSVSKLDNSEDFNEQVENKETETQDVFYDHVPKFRDEVNRTMLLQIGPVDLSFISLDKKLTILEKRYKDISFVSQGNNKLDVFGIIARESGREFICHILKCYSESVVTDIMNTLQSAFNSAFEKSRTVQPSTQHQICVMCPLHQLHKLCQEINGMKGQLAHELLARRVQHLSETDYNEVLDMLRDENPQTHEEMVELIMISLRQLCERKQKEHLHISEGSNSSKPEFNLLEDKTKFFDNFRTKAKKSLATSFENLLRGRKKEDSREAFRKRSWTSENESISSRKGSIDSSPTSTPDASPLASPVSNNFRHTFPSPPSSPDAPRKRSSTVGAIPDPAIAASRLTTTEKHSALSKHNRNVGGNINRNNGNSPIKNIFLFASSPQPMDTPPSFTTQESTNELTPSMCVTPQRQRRSSWRQEIFYRVVTPVQVPESRSITESPVQDEVDGCKLSSSQLRSLWKKAILETLLLIRMEKENHSLVARQDEAQLKRNKLDYMEVIPCLKDVTKDWENILSRPADYKFHMSNLLECVRKGVPRCIRGNIWQLLWKQHVLHKTQSECEITPDADYYDLLKQLTTHQHAILIDLGRTFPGHPYFSVQLGPGQLELFNILKAYSLLDQEVGYCQGLSFIAGILIMHMEEIEAFDTLKYMMFNLGLRVQYRPNMIALQIKLYQLTRLIHDHYKDLYEHFEKYEIGPTLYAAPWFLTLFASQFPLGFVARVFDLLFIQGVDVIYKVALLLLGTHKELIMQCDCFETIVEFLKTTLPEMIEVQMERVINQAFDMNISKQLHAYEVEYHVLREEMIHSSKRGDSDLVHQLEKVHRNLRQQNMDLLEKLQQAHSQQHSLSSALHDSQVNEANLKSRVQTLELERGALLNTVARLRKLVPEEELGKLDSSAEPITPDVNSASDLMYTSYRDYSNRPYLANSSQSSSIDHSSEDYQKKTMMPLSKHNSC
ncbi:hypothetical protein SNE40_020968 [Patella caerulea]|uniref:TBC1 domain family member 4 n=1 Tax=Patella caerulea TaxID=87958 RepID=A0AAN8G971_PATCE